jgi:hypothetical protein
VRVCFRRGRVAFSFEVHRITVALIASVIFGLLTVGASRPGVDGSRPVEAASASRISSPRTSLGGSPGAVWPLIELLIQDAWREISLGPQPVGWQRGVAPSGSTVRPAMNRGGAS